MGWSTPTNRGIVRSFLKGERAGGSKPLTTCGKKLYSFELVIATRGVDGITVNNWVRGGLGVISMTTSKHVGLVKSEVVAAGIPLTLVNEVSDDKE